MREKGRCVRVHAQRGGSGGARVQSEAQRTYFIEFDAASAEPQLRASDGRVAHAAASHDAVESLRARESGVGDGRVTRYRTLVAARLSSNGEAPNTSRRKTGTELARINSGASGMLGEVSEEEGSVSPEARSSLGVAWLLGGEAPDSSLASGPASAPSGGAACDQGRGPWPETLSSRQSEARLSSGEPSESSAATAGGLRRRARLALGSSTGCGLARTREERGTQATPRSAQREHGKLPEHLRLS